MSFAPERLREGLARSLRDAGVEASGHCVALSGGLDSTVLLAALAADRGRAEPPLRAIHVDHSLHPDSSDWSVHCHTLAQELGVPCAIVRVDARPGTGESPEAAARRHRYAALAAALHPGEVLLTAHHGDDQLETVLLQWLRGGGLRAVTGMRSVTRFAAGWLARPLLPYTRAELHDWARGAGLAWLEDPSNTDARFDRNYLRLEVLPRIRARWPAAARTIGRVAAQAGEALDLETEVAAADLAAVAEGRTVVLAKLEKLPTPRQRLALRAWLRACGLDPPALATLEALRRDMLAAAADRIPETRWPGAVVRRYRGRLYAMAVAGRGHDWHPGDLRPGSSFELGTAGRLELVPSRGVGLSRARLAGKLRVTRRPAGGRFHPSGAAHGRELRKWLQERGVLPWWRSELPFVLAGDEVVAVADLAYGGRLAAGPGEPAWRIEWHDRPALTEAEAIAGGPSFGA